MVQLRCGELAFTVARLHHELSSAQFDGGLKLWHASLIPCGTLIHASFGN
jgi:hypothetical protein